MQYTDSDSLISFVYVAGGHNQAPRELPQGQEGPKAQTNHE